MVYTVNFNKYNMEYCVIKTYATKKAATRKAAFFLSRNISYSLHKFCKNF